MGNGWQVEEFGAHHEGRAVAVPADGTEPKPVVFDTGNGPHVHRTGEWWVYDGTLRTPRATGLRAGCSCGWRGETVHPLDWAEMGERAFAREGGHVVGCHAASVSLAVCCRRSYSFGLRWPLAE